MNAYVDRGQDVSNVAQPGAGPPSPSATVTARPQFAAQVSSYSLLSLP